MHTSRLSPLSAFLAAIVCCHPGLAVAADFANGLSPCKSTFANPSAETPSQIAALDLLGSVTQLAAAHGRAVLATNLERTVAINNKAAPAVRANALVDAQITDSNAFSLADGLGATLADIYQRKARFESDDDGVTKRCGEIAPSVSAIIALANGLSGSDSNAGKLGFANGLRGAYTPPPEGTYDVLGKAYGHPAGSPGADKYGNSRPFQTAPLDAASGPRIETYDAMDFYGLSFNTRAVLAGATAAQKAAGINGSDLTNSPSFPSGHTTFGYTESLILAMMVPERFQALAYRGSEYGNSRIALGAHYALDVIAGRTLATYDLAQDLAGRPHYAGDGGPSFQATLASASADLRGFLRQNGCPSIAVCAGDPIARARDAVVWTGGEQRPASPREAYAFRLTYGLAPIGATDRPPEPVPEEAGYLLQSRFPYLTQAQRREILRTTEGPSGYFLDASPLDGAPVATTGKGPVAEAGVYSRLNLFSAAAGYASLAHQVIVDQDHITDPNLKPFDDFTRFDVWSNDIDGPGGLTKRGGGTLRLTGRDTFKGPAVVEQGTLEIAGSLAADTQVAAAGTLAGTGTVGNVTVAAGGALKPGSVDGGGALAVAGSLTLAKDAALTIRPASEVQGPPVRVEGHATLDGAKLIVSAGRPMLPGKPLKVLEANGGISGKFAPEVVFDPPLRGALSYDANAVYLTTEAAEGAKASP
jgi:autotransporter-associated beta strand protein